LEQYIPTLGDFIDSESNDLVIVAGGKVYYCSDDSSLNKVMTKEEFSEELFPFEELKDCSIQINKEKKIISIVNEYFNQVEGVYLIEC